MKAEEVSRVVAPHLPEIFHVNAVPLLDVYSCTVDGDFQPELEEHGRKQECSACHGLVFGAKAVTKVEGETMWAHKEVGKPVRVCVRCSTVGEEEIYMWKHVW